MIDSDPTTLCLLSLLSNGQIDPSWTWIQLGSQNRRLYLSRDRADCKSLRQEEIGPRQRDTFLRSRSFPQQRFRFVNDWPVHHLFRIVLGM